MYDDLNRPLGPVGTCEPGSAWGGLIALVAIFALLIVGIYFVSPQSSDGQRTAQNMTTAPAPTPGMGQTREAH